MQRLRPRRELSHGRPGRAPVARLLVAALLAASGAGAADGAAEWTAACRTATATVRVTWDTEKAPEVSGVVARIGYPRSLELPRSDRGTAAPGRVSNQTGVTGALFDDAVLDRDRDGRHDAVNVGLVGSGIHAGPFAEVRLDCRPGAGVPTARDLTCAAEVAGRAGPVAARCSIDLEVE